MRLQEVPMEFSGPKYWVTMGKYQEKFCFEL